MPEEPNGSEKKKAEVKKVTSAEDFITKAPLFVSSRVNGFHAPESISFDCDTVGCGKETTWYRMHQAVILGDRSSSPVVYPDESIHHVAYMCFKCKKTSLTVVYKEVAWEVRIKKQDAPAGIGRLPSPPAKYRVLVQVMKIGQYPEPSVDLPKGLEKNLGKEAATLYRRALVCRNNGYGLGAAVYMRRVVEDKTNELIEVVAKLAESHGIEAETVSKIRAAGSSDEYTPYEDKLRIASTVFPDSLKVGSVNPFQILYGLVSKAVHSLAEEECIEIADETEAVFDYVFTNLKAQTDDRRAFIEKIKNLT